jgi:hypothetical protein
MAETCIINSCKKDVIAKPAKLIKAMAIQTNIVIEIKPQSYI